MANRPSLLNPLLFYGGAGVARGAGGATTAAPATSLLDVLRKVLEEAGIPPPNAVENTPREETGDATAAQAVVPEVAVPSRGVAPEAGDPFSSTVARVRAELARRENTTRSEHLALDKALSGLSSGGAAQSETVILCEQGGRSGGRVYVANPTSSAVSVQLRVHAVDHEDVHAAIRTEPLELGVAANSIVPVRVAVDLSECNQFAGALQRRLAFMNGEQCLGLCWLTIHVPPP
jgi:hypothetical protein